MKGFFVLICAYFICMHDRFVYNQLFVYIRCSKCKAIITMWKYFCGEFFIITLSLLYKQRSDLATGLGALGVACECCLISKT